MADWALKTIGVGLHLAGVLAGLATISGVAHHEGDDESAALLLLVGMGTTLLLFAAGQLVMLAVRVASDIRRTREIFETRLRDDQHAPRPSR